MKHKEEKEESYHETLKRLIDEYVHKVYDHTINFPKEELFGATSQFRRAALSVALNYIEGYARQTDKQRDNFYKTAYGSLKESRYMEEFSHKRGWLKGKEFSELQELSDKIGGMLWGSIARNKE